MIDTLKQDIRTYLEKTLEARFQQVIPVVVEEPKKADQGDLSVPVFSIVKELRQPLPLITQLVKQLLLEGELSTMIDHIDVMGGFVNVHFDKKAMADQIIANFTRDLLHNQLGGSNEGVGKTIVMDYSSPNIAKTFSIGHLRSTIIGHAIGNLLEKCGYHVVRINHLGDWGTQFGKIIYAYLHYGDPAKVEANPIEELVKLYVDFHEREKQDPNLEVEARAVFKGLEDRNPQYLALWEKFREVSLQEYMKIYDLLGVRFDSYAGEASYVDKTDAIIEELTAKGLLVEDQGAMIVDLGDIAPALIQKSDGTTLYFTRELAALFFRKREYDFDKVLYVVGNEQKLHFEQLRRVVDKMGYDFPEDIIHVNFGLVLQDGKKMSTRKGKIVKLIDVLEEAISMSLSYIGDKNPDLENKEEIAKKIGTSAIIFNDLKNYRVNDFEFNLDEMVNFNGQTGPYLQYTSVRITSILATSPIDSSRINEDVFLDEVAFDMLKEISLYQDTISRAAREFAPSILAKYLLHLASLFNSYYGKERIVVEDSMERNAKFLLLFMVRAVLDDGMKLLGMQVIEKM
ncbi:MAG: arginine--tRNA ligase [Candidatus Izemoplasmatales bacterium]